MGKLRSNFTGDQFVMYSVGEAPGVNYDNKFNREELGGIY